MDTLKESNFSDSVTSPNPADQVAEKDVTTEETIMPLETSTLPEIPQEPKVISVEPKTPREETIENKAVEQQENNFDNKEQPEHVVHLVHELSGKNISCHQIFRFQRSCLGFFNP